MTKLKLKADKRTITGRKVKNLRNEGILPANIFGKKVKSISVQVEKSSFESTFKDAGETGIIELSLGKETRPVLVHGVQIDPVTDEPIHVDFFQVNLKEKVTANVPLELIGEAPAEKQKLGTLVQQLDEIEVEALPTDLPDKYELDVSDLKEVDDMLTVADLKTDAKVEVLNDKEQIIAKIEALREEEEEPVPVAEGDEVAVEGEAPVEGEGEEAPEGGEEAPEETPEEK